MSYTLVNKIIIKGTIIAETGLMIGGSSSALEIGGPDKQIIRNPVDKSPYIPGSSLKGKMRSLLEQAGGDIGYDGLASQNPDGASNSALLFGFIKANAKDEEAANGQAKHKKQQRPSRLIVRDGALTEISKTKLSNTELLYTEIKAENSINRITAEANPRFFERVPKSAEFDLNMTLNIFKGEDESLYLKLIYESLRLIQDDYLGGGGSRGNGQVKFKITSVKKRGKAYYQTGKDADENTSLLDAVPSDLK